MSILPQTRYGGTGVLLVVFWITALVCVFCSDTISDVLANSGLFFLSIFAGSFLQKTVKREQQQKEHLTEMLSFASHQFRSPLAVIAGYASMVHDGDAGPISERQRQIVGTMCENTKQLSRIVDEFLTVAKVEHQGLSFDMFPFDLASLAKEVLSGGEVNLQRKDIDSSFAVDGRMPYLVYGDKEKIRHVLLNIIDNAITYTEQGTIRAQVSKTDEDEVCFSVADTGVGIARADLDTIFQKFKRGSSGRTVADGSGIGLYLAKVIIDRHGGRIWAESKGEGKGATVSIVFPALVSEAYTEEYEPSR